MQKYLSVKKRIIIVASFYFVFATMYWLANSLQTAFEFNMWKEAIFASFLIFFVLGIMSVIERAIRLKFYPDPVFEKQIEKKSVQPAKTRIKKVTP